MDINISVKKKVNWYRYALIGLALVFAIFVIYYLLSLGSSEFSVDRNSVVLDEVKRGKFKVSVRGTGVLVPDNIQWISAETEATVARVVLKSGNMVQAGGTIVELSNPQLSQDLLEVQWELEAMEAELLAERLTQESYLQQQTSNALNAKLEYERNAKEYEAREELVKTGVVSKLDFNRARLEMDQAKQRWISSEEQLKKIEENLVAQNKARSARVNQVRKRVERAQHLVDSLVVTASMDSLVLEVPLEAGQRIAIGDNIAKLSQHDSLIAELQVPEIQIRDVAVGQKVVIDTRNNKVNGSVIRITPAVVNGNVQVDVGFTEALPSDARPDLSVDGEIKIAEIADTLYVNRPLFSQSQSRSFMYRLTEDGKFAERLEVMIGYGSVSQIQITAGLEAGDRIVTSDPSRFESYQRFRIN